MKQINSIPFTFKKMCTTNDENRTEKVLAFTRSLNGIEPGPAFDEWCDNFGEPTLRYQKELPCLGGNTTANRSNGGKGTKSTRNFMRELETTLVLKTHNGLMYLTWPNQSGGCFAFSKCKCYSDGSINIEYICYDSGKNKSKNMNMVYDNPNRPLNLKDCKNPIYI